MPVDSARRRCEILVRLNTQDGEICDAYLQLRLGNPSGATARMKAVLTGSKRGANQTELSGWLLARGDTTGAK